MVDNITTILELDGLGVEVVSVQEPWLDTGSPVRSLLIAIFSWGAEQERNRLSERTKAGIERARRKGIHVGRPPATIDVGRASDLLAQGASVPQVAHKLHVGISTLRRALQSGGPRPDTAVEEGTRRGPRRTQPGGR